MNILSKTVERVVYNQLSEYLESNNLLSDNQYGFRRKRSTRDAVTKATDHIHEHMDKGKVTGALFMDLRKAFDSVNHSCLLHKLPYYGILGRKVEWICSYLFHRSQIVTIDGVLSDREYITHGVPQGSILVYICIYIGVYNSYDFDSDHRLVVADLNTPGNKFSRFRKRNPKVAHKKYDFAALQTEEINHNFLTNLSNMWENSQTIDINNTAINDRLVQSIKAAAAVTIPERAAQKLYQPWHSARRFSICFTDFFSCRSVKCR